MGDACYARNLRDDDPRPMICLRYTRSAKRSARVVSDGCATWMSQGNGSYLSYLVERCFSVVSVAWLASVWGKQNPVDFTALLNIILIVKAEEK
jgi:hypothetical protein